MDNTRPNCYAIRSCDVALYYWRHGRRPHKETTMPRPRWYHYLLGLLTWPLWRTKR